MIINRLPYAIDKMRGKNSFIDQAGGAVTLSGLGKQAQSYIVPYLHDAEQSLGLSQKTEIKPVFGLEDKMLGLIKNHSDVWTQMSQHLGDVSLDIMYTFSTNYGVESHRNSQLWHHDSVGRRLKLFFVAKPDLTPSLVIEARRGGCFSSPYMTADDRKAYVPKAEIQELFMNPDDAYLVDTDYIHRGKIGEPCETRIALVVEFSSRWKRFCRGKVGKRAIP